MKCYNFNICYGLNHVDTDTDDSLSSISRCCSNKQYARGFKFYPKKSLNKHWMRLFTALCTCFKNIIEHSNKCCFSECRLMLYIKWMKHIKCKVNPSYDIHCCFNIYISLDLDFIKSIREFLIFFIFL